MLTMNDLNPLLRRRSTVITGDGDKVGTVGVVYLNDVDEQPTWVTVHTGLFGSRESFVPLEGGSVQGHDLVVAYPRDLIRHAPSVDRDGHLSPEEEAGLYRHYGLQITAPPRESSLSDRDAVAASPAQPSVASHAASSASASHAASSSASAAAPAASSVSPAQPSVASHAASSASTSHAASSSDSAATPATSDATGPSAAEELSAASALVEARHGLDEREAAESSRMPTVSETAAIPEPPTSARFEESQARSGVHTHDDGGTPWVVRSEERLRVGTEQYEAERVRLRKYVVTEEEAVSVPLMTEEVRVVVEPITSSTTVDLGSAFQEESVELVAREEVAVVGKETVPVERVRMRTVEVAARATVRDSVRKERIAVTVDGDATKDVDGSGRTPARRKKPAAPKTDASPKSPMKSTNALVKGKKKRR